MISDHAKRAAKMAEFHAYWAPRLLSLLRVVAALLFIEHGTMKLLGFPFDPAMPAHAPVELMSLMGLAGILEFLGGVLLLLGVLTRPMAFILSGEMAVAYFMMHAQQSLYPAINHGDAAILFCFVFLYIAAAGGGSYSLDNFMRRCYFKKYLKDNTAL